MDIFDMLTLIGGVCLFLFGMNIMGQALERRTGSRLEALLGRLTTGKAAGFFTGLCVTALIQSSSATAVMVVGFVNSGLMTLRQAIHVILGANVGTTVTAWVLSLAGLESDSLLVSMLKPTAFTPVLALLGIFKFLGGKETKARDTGAILLGFATLMYGMETMSGAVAGLSDLPAFRELFLLFRNPLLGLLAGALLTAVIQSSTASIGILQALCVTGQVSYAAAIPIIMGQNIGTCVTALISSVGATRNARRAAVVHLSFNLIGSLFWLAVFVPIRSLVAPAMLDAPATLLGIAVTHTAFNLLCTLLFLPLTGLLEWLAYRLVPDAPAREDADPLDDRLLTSPAVALERCREQLVIMADEAFSAARAALTPPKHTRTPGDATADTSARVRALEESTDRREDALGTYLIRLSSHRPDEDQSAEAAGILRMIGDLERIADHAVSLQIFNDTLREKGLTLSPEALAGRQVLAAALRELMTLTRAALVDRDLLAAGQVEPLRQVINRRREELRAAHVLRLQSGACDPATSANWTGQLDDCSRMADHCSNIAACVLETSRRRMTVHATARALRASDPSFIKAYGAFEEKYRA